MASRGIEPSELKNKDIWWNGSKWLKEKDSGPKQPKAIISETNLEKKIQQTKTWKGNNQHEKDFQH